MPPGTGDASIEYVMPNGLPTSSDAGNDPNLPNEIDLDGVRRDDAVRRASWTCGGVEEERTDLSPLAWTILMVLEGMRIRTWSPSWIVRVRRESCESHVVAEAAAGACELEAEDSAAAVTGTSAGEASIAGREIDVRGLRALGPRA